MLRQLSPSDYVCPGQSTLQIDSALSWTELSLTQRCPGALLNSALSWKSFRLIPRCPEQS